MKTYYLNFIDFMHYVNMNEEFKIVFDEILTFQNNTYLSDNSIIIDPTLYKNIDPLYMSQDVQDRNRIFNEQGKEINIILI